jgi:hypothetical protein
MSESIFHEFRLFQALADVVLTSQITKCSLFLTLNVNDRVSFEISNSTFHKCKTKPCAFEVKWSPDLNQLT